MRKTYRLNQIGTGLLACATALFLIITSIHGRIMTNRRHVNIHGVWAALGH